MKALWRITLIIISLGLAFAGCHSGDGECVTVNDCAERECQSVKCEFREEEGLIGDCAYSDVADAPAVPCAVGEQTGTCRSGDCDLGTGGSGGAGGSGGTDSCRLDVECDPQDFENPTFCDGPCRTFCRTSGTDSYGSCGDFDPSMRPPDTSYCVCHCFTEECP